MEDHLLRMDKVLWVLFLDQKEKVLQMGAQGTLDKDLSQTTSDLPSPCLMHDTNRLVRTHGCTHSAEAPLLPHASLGLHSPGQLKSSDESAFCSSPLFGRLVFANSGMECGI